MIELRATSLGSQLHRRLVPNVFRLTNDGQSDSKGHLLVPSRSDYLREVRLRSVQKNYEDDSGEWVVAPNSMSYLKAGDVIAISSDGRVINSLWRGNGTTNSLLLTERCDNLCLMCSQPPRERKDDWLIAEAFDVISLMPKDAEEIGLTGGEPTIYGHRFIELLNHISRELPETAVHILSNGRRFADPAFAEQYAGVSSERTMIGIPIYGAEASLHDYVVQSKNAFDETINGVLNLAERKQSIEIRIVLHRLTAPRIVEIAEFIARNLTFVDQVAFMGLEMMGLARKNIEQLWIEPEEYAESLAEAVQLIDAHGVKALVYNHQLCLLHQDIWPFAVKSISDWKNEYDEVCSGCDVLEECGGFFHSAKYGSSDLIRPIYKDGSPKKARDPSLIRPSHDVRWQRRRIPLKVVQSSDVFESGD